jgi:hypothetical protein
MNDTTMSDDEAFEAEVKLVERAIERLAQYPHEVAGACLHGMSDTAIDVLAAASDAALDEFSEEDVLRALRFVCRLALTLRQAKRYADIFERAAP